MSAAPAPARSLRQLCHDLSQPLTAARGSLELALSLPEDNPARREFFADTVAALDRMVEIARALSDLAEPAAPAAPLLAREVQQS